MEQKISVIVPFYNSERTIEKCIKSIIAQSYKNIEIILINDGSKDQSRYICEKYSLLDDRIILIDKENGGVSSARNFGLEIATGRYIMFCDSDDWVEENWCKILINNYIEDSLVMCDAFIEGKNNYYQKDKLKCEKEVFDRIDFYKLKDYFFNSPWNKIYSKEIIKKNNIKFNTDIWNGEDLLFNVTYLSCITGKIIVLNSTQYHYRWPVFSSLSNKITKDYCNQCEQSFQILNKAVEKMGILNNNAKKRIYTDYFNEIKRGIDYIFDSKEIKIIEKWKLVNQIMNNNVYQKCISKAFISENKIYNSLFRCNKCYFIWIIHLFRRINL